MKMPAETSPRWNLDSIFPGLESSKLIAATDRLDAGISGLTALLADQAGTATGADVALVERALVLLDDTTAHLTEIGAWLYSLTSTDSFDEAAQAAQSALQPLQIRFSVVEKQLTAWLAELDLEPAAAQSDLIRDHLYVLERMQFLAGRLLDPAAEVAVASLAPSGGLAWGRLQEALVSRETISLSLPGQEPAELGIADLSNLLDSSSAETRQLAAAARMELVNRNRTSFAAAMNSIKGESREIARLRGWESPLHASLHMNSISMPALEAMQTACREAFPKMRGYLKAKAGLLGQDVLAWWDLTAPVTSASDTRTYTWDEARDFVIRQFGTYSADLADFARRAFAEQWLDGPPRKGKTNGAYMTGFPLSRESRIMLNFGGSLEDVLTIAHELGHAWHAECCFRAGRTTLQSSSPMTLAETASIFCETIVLQALLESAGPGERLAILDQDLSGAALLMLDIHSRFLLESRVFDLRQQRELSENELDRLMRQAQIQVYGDSVDPETLDHTVWASKSHYYSPELSFYNYPYTFGWLFGLGLHAQYLQQPEGFEARYNALLSATGMQDATGLAAGFGIDIEDPAFWRGSLVVLDERIQEYLGLAASA